MAVGVAALLVPLGLLMLRTHAVVPRSVLLLDPLLLVLFMGGSRLLYRAWKEHRFSSLLQTEREPLLVMGAGSAASLVRELSQSKEWRVVGLLDNSAAKLGRDIHGVAILGTLDSLPAHASRMDVKHAVIAMPSAPHSVRRHAAQLCNEAGVTALTVPAFEDLVSGPIAPESTIAVSRR